MKKIALHWRIIGGIVLGALFAVLLIQFSWGTEFVVNWIKPWGTIFINLLKLIAIPLIVTSLIKGIADLKDVSSLSKIGGRTILVYMLTTFAAVIIGLGIVNLIKPGMFVGESTRVNLLAGFEDMADKKLSEAETVLKGSPLQPLVDIVPENFFSAAMSNTNMLQVIFFTILFGIGLVMIPEDKGKPVVAFFDGANEVILKMIDLIMKMAPFGVFALIAALVAESPSIDIFAALGAYAGTVLLGLVILLYLLYSSLIWFFGKMSPKTFFKGIAPAQLVAFSTSSSAATLPVTMECVEERLKVEKEITSFVLPVGATINMDGTVLYQAVAAVFIAQVMGYDLTIADQLTLVLTASLAGIGAAAVPGAGILMLIIVLESIGVNPAGIALIFAIDRPLDMCRTVVNISGDAMASVIVQRYVKKSKNGSELGLQQT